MVNEHYVPQSYLRLFAPEDEGLVSRYSLVEKHGGGDYVPPKNHYSIRKAASAEGFADGFLETDHTSKAEQWMIESLQKITRGEELSVEDIVNISKFIGFQFSRTAESKLHFEAREKLANATGENIDQYWRSVVGHNADIGYESLQFMGWIIVENESSVPFTTSDEPVVHYFDADRDEIDDTLFQFEQRQIFCPVGPDHQLILLDPAWFQVDSQHPQTEIEHITISDSQEVLKFNFLQGVKAFQEIFGPAGEGELLEQIIQVLCDAFPDEDYIRGNRADLETIRKAQDLAAGGIETPADRDWYMEKGRPLILSRRKKAQALWDFNDSISLIDDLRRQNPKTNYWEELLDRDT